MQNNKTPNSRAGVIAQASKISLLCVSIALVSACGKTIKPEQHKPTKLVQLEQSVNVVEPVLQTNVSGRSKLADVNRFEVGFDGKQIVAASNSGKVSSYGLNGQALWSTDLKEDIVGGVAFDGASQTAVVTTKSARVVALNTADGSIKWQNKLSGTVLAPALIHNNRVLLSANDGVMHGLSLQTGESIWKFTTQTPSISVRGSAKPTLLDQRTALLGGADGRLHAVDIEAGIPLWNRRVGIPSGASEIQRMTDIDGTPTVDQGQLLAVSYSGQLLAADLASGQVTFLQEAASKNSLAVTDRAVISTTLDGKVKAYNRQTGELLWENDDLAYRQLSNPERVGNYIAIGDLDGVVHFLSPEDGRIVSRTQTKGAINKLTSASGYLLTQTKSGQVSVWRMAR
ncbi:MULTISPECIES: outer membrane protein assembly factor BamB [Psychrobacter]|jgi:outer membrane protein assembly factor BamB|uniref:Outer membrane protein assembly factor BamB n=2 Tax=Psychrobacter TaxID=497 RepID=A0A844M247_9GAMM|nr:MULTISPECIES: outer membrane protein assembly factor BamB [Psychrobacter]MUG33021.1 outer membrane protein assembly factor BamB [Psychrobacter sanguinis]UNK04991.1 outer membrane protein assembly factor BamB [Psychrobacter sp. PraFG1]